MSLFQPKQQEQQSSVAAKTQKKIPLLPSKQPPIACGQTQENHPKLQPKQPLIACGQTQKNHPLFLPEQSPVSASKKKLCFCPKKPLYAETASVSLPSLLLFFLPRQRRQCRCLSFSSTPPLPFFFLHGSGGAAAFFLYNGEVKLFAFPISIEFIYSQTLQKMAADVSCCGTKFALYLLMIVGLVCFACLMAGLTLGLMSLGLVDLEVLIKSGRRKDRIHAGTVLLSPRMNLPPVLTNRI